jgi:hypothetical protein
MKETGMTKDQVDELMRENGIVVVGEAIYILCNLVEAESAVAERKACVKMMDEMRNTDRDGVIEAIRARGNNGL